MKKVSRQLESVSSLATEEASTKPLTSRQKPIPHLQRRSDSRARPPTISREKKVNECEQKTQKQYYYVRSQSPKAINSLARSRSNGSIIGEPLEHLKTVQKKSRVSSLQHKQLPLLKTSQRCREFEPQENNRKNYQKIDPQNLNQEMRLREQINLQKKQIQSLVIEKNYLKKEVKELKIKVQAGEKKTDDLQKHIKTLEEQIKKKNKTLRSQEIEEKKRKSSIEKQNIQNKKIEQLLKKKEKQLKQMKSIIEEKKEKEKATKSKNQDELLKKKIEKKQIAPHQSEEAFSNQLEFRKQQIRKLQQWLNYKYIEVQMTKRSVSELQKIKRDVNKQNHSLRRRVNILQEEVKKLKSSNKKKMVEDSSNSLTSLTFSFEEEKRKK